jgi:amino acid permease
MSIKDHDPDSTGSDAADAEKVDFTASGNEPPHHSLQRQLKNRHIAMIR